MFTNKIKYLLCLIVIITGIQTADATHVVGGNLRYRHISGDRYEITLTFRRDCITGSPDAAFDNPANVWIFNGDGNLKVDLGVNGRLKMNFNPDDTLNNIIMSDCGFEGTQVCVHQTTYRETVRLPFKPGENGYILAYQRCCRNPTLENIVDPLLTGGTWAVEVSEQAILENNTSPKFNQWPDVYICANEDLIFDHSATDANGDSLVYRLCTPFSGASVDNPIPTTQPTPPYDEIVWNAQAGYGLSDLLGGTPLQIDPNTGLLIGKPSTVGQFLVGICVEEYRDGVKIGEVRRDFQFNVRVCSDPPTAIFDANNGDCNGPEVQFDNQSLSGSEYQWNFNFPSTNPAFLSAEANPVFIYDQPGVYDVQLIVVRGTDSCSDTIIRQVAALYTDIEVLYDLEIYACNEDGTYTIRLIDKSIEPEVGFDIIDATWVITQGDNSQTYIGQVITIDIDPTDIDISLQVESETGCKKTETSIIDIDDFTFVADFTYALDGCNEGGIAAIAFEDISDNLNIYDSPQGYVWTINSVLGVSTFTAQNFVADVSVGETITVDLEVDFGGGCNASISKTISLEDILPQSSYDTRAEGCPDDGTIDYTFINTSDNNTTLNVNNTSWEVIVGGTTTTSMDIEYTVNIPKDSLVIMTMISEFENGCNDTINATFVPGPFATISFQSENLIVCLGDTLPFVINPNSDFTYTWEPTDGLFFENGNDLSDPKVIGIADTEYSVTVTDGLCTIESSLSITVLDSQNIKITGDSIVCDGLVSLSVIGGIGAGDFIWSTTPDFTDIIHTGNILETSFDDQSQTYYAAFTGESCDDPYAEFNVILSNIFDVVFNGDPVRVCLGDTVPLLSNPDPSLTYVWSPLDNGITFTNPTDGSTAQVIGTEDKVYNVTISDDFCTLDTMIAVGIADAQDFQVLGDSIVCDENVMLIGFGATGIGTYQWSLDESFTSIIHEGDTLRTELTGLSEIYFVQFTDKTCGDLLLSYHVRQFVYDILTVEPFMICPGDTLTYSIFNQGEGPLTFQWTADPHIITGENTTTPQVGVGMNETEDFVLIYAATSPTGCVHIDTISFEIMDNPVVDFDFDLQECGEFTVCFTIDGEFNGFPNWNFGDLTTEDDKSIDEAPCYTYPGPGVYDVILNNITAVCPFEDIVKTITINDDINLDPIDTQIVCLGAEVSVTATTSDLDVDYTWCNLAGDTIQTGANYTATVNEAYKVIVKIEDPNGCTDTDTVDIAPFVFNIEDTVPEVFCTSENTDIEIFINGTQEGYTYQWGPEECVISGANTAHPILIASDAKEYTVTITYDSLGCEFIKTYPITTTSFDITLEATPDTVINQGDEVVISVIDPFDDYMYEWSDGTTGDVLTDTPQESATYYVTVTDEMGCTATDTIFVRVRIPECDENDVFLPTGFTPNGDGVNDILYLRSNFIDNMELLIYDRWGEEVFRTTDQTIGWDGTFRGAKLEPDVFAYALRVTCINQEEYRTRGNVSLLK
ncbi:MAG: gliding motility-associated C-terminal domain-containing protein [Saprospiraceae bacterium]